jgi:vancomycin resistance protein YoaR
MKQGKFEAPRRKASDTEQNEKRTSGRRLDWLLFAIPVLVVLAVAAIVFVGLRREKEMATEPEGLTREETLEMYRRMAEVLENGDMVLTLYPDDPASPDEPIVLTIPPSVSKVCVDLTGLEADLEEGVGKVSRRRFVTDSSRYISLDRSALRELADQTAKNRSQSYLPSFVGLDTWMEGEHAVQDLTVNTGRRGRIISADTLYDTLLDAYLTGRLDPSMTYEARTPAPLDPEEILSKYCTEPVDAVLNTETFAITPDVPGYGFTRETIEAVLEKAEEGRGYSIAMTALVPNVTAADVEAALYADVLAEAHTPHSWVDDRTVNLMLSCAALNGTVIMPGQTFSFNETVGERTEEKGYREAIAYVGGASVPEIGGGVCQVASSIYYAVLQADLRSVERHAHTYLVTYVPQGMDAAIYWGSLDYKFENTSPYPIKIEASVSDGDVHIILRGTEWKDYTLKLSYKVLEEIPWETKERVVTDGSYKSGDTIVTPYTGYRIATYKTICDLEGNKLETQLIANSSYRKRDKVVAVVPPKPTVTEPTSGSNDD